VYKPDGNLHRTQESGPTEPYQDFDISDGSRLGTIVEHFGNLLTVTRGVGAIGLQEYIRKTPDYQTWGTVAIFTGLALTDVDGKFSRLGRKLQNKDENIRRPFNAYGDQLTDKLLVNLTTEAIVTRENKGDDPLYARMVEAASTITIARDVVTTVDRIMADCQDIDTRAQRQGKAKAILQFISLGTALSPVAKNRIAKKAIGIALLYSAKKSIESGLTLHESFTEARRAKRLKQTQI